MTRRVLIVDDNRSLAEDLGEILEAEGYEPQIFDDPRAVLAASATLQFDVGLLDVRMPGLDGVALHEALAHAHPEARFVLMTAYTEDDRIAAALAAGVRAVLNKPVAIDLLISTLSETEGLDVLIVEDDPTLCDSLSEMIALHGYRCHKTGSVAEARAFLAGKRPDVALVDLRLPDGDGALLAAELVGKRGIEVVLTTGYDAECAERVIREKLRERGRLLVKPFAPNDVLRLIDELNKGRLS